MSAQVFYAGERTLSGTIAMPPSKSMAHRALICGFLSNSRCTVKQIELSEDIMATMAVIKALGGQLHYDEKARSVHFLKRLSVRTARTADCSESGSTLRFLVPIAAAMGIQAVFTGRGRLPDRPIDILRTLLTEHGVRVSEAIGLPLKINGQLKGGRYELAGNVSSQFISGLLFALPLLHEDSEIRLTTNLESEGYVKMTIAVLEAFGVRIEEVDNGYRIKGQQVYQAEEYTVEGDWSQAPFFLTMAAAGGAGITLTGLNLNSVQGDAQCIELYRRFGLKIDGKEDRLNAVNPTAAQPFGGLTGTTVDAAQIPDMVPALAICGMMAQGRTIITNAARLRIKESDRLAAIADAIRCIGGVAEERADGLVIHGREAVRGGMAKGMNDHRIVMALAAASAKSRNGITVTDAYCINKSYPNFYADYQMLGGIADVIDMGT